MIERAKAWITEQYETFRFQQENAVMSNDLTRSAEIGEFKSEARIMREATFIGAVLMLASGNHYVALAFIATTALYNLIFHMIRTLEDKD